MNKENHIHADRIGLREALSSEPKIDGKAVLKFSGFSTILMGGMIGLFNFCNKLPGEGLNITQMTATASALGILFEVIVTLGYSVTAARQRGWGKNRG